MCSRHVFWMMEDIFQVGRILPERRARSHFPSLVAGGHFYSGLWRKREGGAGVRMKQRLSWRGQTVLLRGICAETNVSFLIRVCEGLGNFLPHESEQYAIHGVLFPSDKIKLNCDFYSQGHLRRASSRYLLCPIKILSKQYLWEVLTGLPKTKTLLS